MACSFSAKLNNQIRIEGKKIEITEEDLIAIFIEEILSNLKNNNNNNNSENNFNNFFEPGCDLSNYFIYQFRLILLNLTIIDKFQIIKKFLNNISKENKQILLEINPKEKFNIFSIRLFLNFWGNFIKYWKFQPEEIRFESDFYLDQKDLIKSVFNLCFM